MGLDVSVYKDIKIVSANKEDDDVDHYYFFATVPYDGWKDKIKNLNYGKKYLGVEIPLVGVSYSYSTHNRFREKLIQIIGREDLLLPDGKINWDVLSESPDIPFYDFIYFSDCEGCLDWEVSEKIYNDFVKYKGNVLKDEPQYYSVDRYYNDWLEVFEAASKNRGVVVFS